jgi:hypothetical protein
VHERGGARVEEEVADIFGEEGGGGRVDVEGAVKRETRRIEREEREKEKEEEGEEEEEEVYISIREWG